MTEFKKWLRQAYREPHTTFTEHNMEVAYLAGQASAEERVKELEQKQKDAYLLELDLRGKIIDLEKALAEKRSAWAEQGLNLANAQKERDHYKERAIFLRDERDEAVRQWERFERMAGDNWAALKAQAGEYIRRWNIEPDGDDLLICDGNHDKHEKCEYIRYTPASTVKAQAGEPVGYHFSYTTPFGHVVWDIDYTPRPDAIECYPLVRAHPTTEHPYNPLNDYAVIPMNPTEPVKAQAGESVDYRYKATDGVRYSK